jgi:hypothetical protein
MDPRERNLRPNQRSVMPAGVEGVRIPGPPGVNYGYDPRAGSPPSAAYRAGVAGHQMAYEAEEIAMQAAAENAQRRAAANAERRAAAAAANAERRAAAAAVNAQRRAEQAERNAAAAARRAEINGIARGRFEQRYPRNATGARPGLPVAPRRQSKSAEEFALHRIRQAVEAEMQPAAAAPAAAAPAAPAGRGFIGTIKSWFGYGGKRTKRRTTNRKKSRRSRR